MGLLDRSRHGEDKTLWFLVGAVALLIAALIASHMVVGDTLETVDLQRGDCLEDPGFDSATRVRLQSCDGSYEAIVIARLDPTVPDGKAACLRAFNIQSGFEPDAPVAAEIVALQPEGAVTRSAAHPTKPVFCLVIGESFTAADS